MDYTTGNASWHTHDHRLGMSWISIDDPEIQYTDSAGCQAWHCDMGADVLALHVRSLPESGGNTFVASSWTIYKELAKSYPTVLKALCDANWPIQV